jgi:hypothetical protein
MKKYVIIIFATRIKDERTLRRRAVVWATPATIKNVGVARAISQYPNKKYKDQGYRMK